MTAQNLSAELMKLVNGFRVSQAIHVAATLGIADLLKEGGRSSNDLAAATNCHPGTLYRLLRALAAAGLFHEHGDRLFSATPLGECLRSDADQPVAPYAALVGRAHQWQAWGALLHSVRTGQNAYRHVHGVSLWEYLTEHPEEATLFNRGMTGNSQGLAEAIMAAYDLSAFGCVADVGGGQGAILASILAAHRTMRGILFDQPDVVAEVRPVLEAAGVADRCDIAGGNFFQAVPKGGDAYILKRVLHDFDDVASLAILKVCRQVIRPSGRLLIMERIVAPANEGLETKISDLNMLVSPGGQERTADEFAALLAAAAFRLNRIVEVNSLVSVVEAAPV